MEINFWNKTSTLYINGVACARKRNIILVRGEQTDTAQFFSEWTDEAVRVLTNLFCLHDGRTLFKKRVYFENDPLGWDYSTADGWNKVAVHDGKIFADEIKTIEVKTTYTICPNVSMKNLFDYPAQLVVDYLKERGITTCPLIK
jgi:hypothetical protein